MSNESQKIHKHCELLKIYWRRALESSVLFCFCLAAGTLFGIILGTGFKALPKFSGRFIAITISFLFLLCIVIYYIYYKKINNIISEHKHLVRITYFGVMIFIFLFYYNYNYSNIVASFSGNTMGIGKTQYVFILYFVVFIILASIIYAVVFLNYTIKKIGSGGIELEERKDEAASEQFRFISDFITLIQNQGELSARLGDAIEEFIKTFNLENGGQIEAEKFFELLRIILSNFIKGAKTIKGIDVMLMEDIEEIEEPYLITPAQFNYLQSEVKQNSIFKLDKIVVIPYRMKVIQEDLVFIIEFTSKEDSSVDAGNMLFTSISLFDNIFLHKLA